jgi:hypothetical protein
MCCSLRSPSLRHLARLTSDETLIATFLTVERILGSSSEWAPYLRVGKGGGEGSGGPRCGGERTDNDAHTAPIRVRPPFTVPAACVCTPDIAT